MQRPGMDEENAQPEDFICDYCRNHWSPTRPMVEGHKGSLICGECLSLAYVEVVLKKGGVRLPEMETCTTCLQNKDEAHWRSDRVSPGPAICTWCIEKSARMLEKDKDADWVRPTA